MNIKDDDLAVIGMSGRFPGASNVAEFWDNICARKESIHPLSDAQLRTAGVAERDIADPDYVKAAALLDGIDRFDPGFFKMSPLEAELMDPQIRLLLQCAWETLEDAGHARKEAQHIGVFAGAGGVTTSYFANYVNRSTRFQKVTAGAAHLGNDKDFLATYISYKLNLTGPSVTVQTACSTSLVALHQARLSLLSGECDMALAGGVTVRVPHVQGYQYQEGYIFSRSGRISSFDEQADGVVFGSGLGLVLLKRLSAAIADGDNIHAVIKGSAIMNDGKGKMSYAASSARGQIACVRAALAKAGVDAGSIGFVEAHGTGTAMGDPEEVKALASAFREHTDQKGFCALGSVKANIGHLEAAAGIAGFIKAVLAVKHGLIPPTARFSHANARIKFEQTPFFVNTSLQQWNSGKLPRRAAVNSLGVGGTNAFVILEQYAAPKKRARKPKPVLVPLSARTPASLEGAVRRLAQFLERAASGKAGANLVDLVDLVDLAYTLQTGREAMGERAMFSAATAAELHAALLGFLDGERAAPAGSVATSWLAGEEVDWAQLYPGTKAARISLPTYAFAQDYCWIADEPAAAARQLLHPLLHANTSDLSEQKYSATFSGDEFFLADHQVRSGSGADLHRVLPGVAYLEMARAALQAAAPEQHDGDELELADVVWLRPLRVAGPAQVQIALAPGTAQVGFEVYTGDQRGDQLIHCQGHSRFVAASARSPLDLARLAASMEQGTVGADHIYQAFAAMGLAYGPAHRVLTTLARGQDQLLARLALPAALRAGQGDYVLHPSMMDGAFQAATALLFELAAPPAHPIVPFAIASVRVAGPCTADMFVWARRAQNGLLDIDLIDADGVLCVEMRGFAARPLVAETAGSLLATRDWRPAAASAAGVAGVQSAQHVILCGLAPPGIGQVAANLSLWAAAPEQDVGEQYSALALVCLDKLQAIMRDKPQAPVLVQLVFPATADTAIFAGLAGMFKTARLEHPLVGGQVLFVDPAIDTARLAALLAAEAAAPDDTLVRYQDGNRHTAAWQLAGPHQGARFDTASPFKANGVYLITGGLGGLGLLFARELLARAADAHIVLTGRAKAPDAGQQVMLAALQESGASVAYRQLELENRSQVEQALASVREQYGQLNGIIHSAGMTADAFILNKTGAEMRSVLGPKVAGAVNLDHAARDADLDFFVLFSSLTSALGNLGQADYAAANGFLEQFALVRNSQVQAGQRQGATVAIAWPLWQDGGMQPQAEARAMLRDAFGIEPMQTATGMRMFYRSLALGAGHTLVMEGRLRAMQEQLVGAPRALQAAPASGASSASARSAEAFLCAQLSTLLKLPLERIDPAAPLADFGIDSILALDLTRVLETTFGALPKTLFFEYLTIGELAAYFVRAHGAALSAMSGAPAVAQAAPTLQTALSVASIRTRGQRFGRAATARADEAVAIVGLSGRYPQARDLQAFWNNLRDAKDCIVEVPAERWNWRDYYSEERTIPGRHYSKWGGFIEGVDEFDARFFNISPLEAVNIDPQERLFLQHAWLAMEDAGYTRAALQVPNGDGLPAQVGVYAGVMYGEYQLLGAEASLQGKPMGFASNLSSIANRVSFALNLHGPSMAVDTMCSSSLTAIHLACQDLKLGRTALGIAGGVNVTIHPNKYLMLSAGQFISSDGACQSFGEGGDGYIPGEGVGVVILKRLSEAQRDGNQIYGVIRGSALSHGGRTNGYTVPNPQAQASAIRQALAEAGVDARHISYIEAHGTGTRLGDPIEIAALSRVFQESTADTGFCQIGSAKSNIGHCEAAAGIAGLTKVLLQLKHKQIVPSLHSARLNPHIDFASTPFVVNQTLRSWERPLVDGKALPRIAGISSFGAGGANAHLVVEEYEQAAIAGVAPAPCIVPLSARTAQQLREKVAGLVAFIGSQAQPLPFGALAATLQSGREAMDERLAVVASSVESLVSDLTAWLSGAAPAARLWQGNAKAAKGAPAAPPAGASLETLAALWTGGVVLDWAGQQPGPRPGMISLPGYPFARQRFWVDAVTPSQRAQALGARALHPLLHTNTSDFSQQSYAGSLDAGMLAHAEAAFLEMARAAVDLALPPAQGKATALRDVAWAQPRVLAAGQTITVALFEQHDERVGFEIYSTVDGAEVLHCQGQAVRLDQAAPGAIDIAAIMARSPAALRELKLAAGEEYVLHPALLQAALDGAAPKPVSLASLLVAAPGVRATLAWIRPSASARGAIDIDLCDSQGRIAAQVRALHALAAIDALAPAAPVEPIAVAPKAVAFLPDSAVAALPQAVAVAAVAAKPAASIVLRAPGSSRAVPDAQAALARPRLALAATGAAPASMPAASAVALFDHGAGVFSIRLTAPATRNLLSRAVAADLQHAMRAVSENPSAKVLLIEGGAGAFMTGGLHEHHDAMAGGMYLELAQLACPVIAVVEGDAEGAGFLFAALCDFIVCSDTAALAFASPADGLYPYAAEDLLAERFGRVHANDFLYLSSGLTGAAVKAKGWTFPILPAGEVRAHARGMADSLAAKTADSLRLLKQHLARRIVAAVSGLQPSIPVPAPLAIAPQAATPLVSPSQCLTVEAQGEHVLTLTFAAQSQAAGTGQMLVELQAVLAQIGATPALRCVLLASRLDGFLPDEDDAAAMASGFAQALAGLQIPVIAALERGASGLGWHVAQACDGFVVAEEGSYQVGAAVHPPQMAALMALRLGARAAQQLMLAGGIATGAELRDQYGLLHAVPGAAVGAAALKLAHNLARLPAGVLAAWKARAARTGQAGDTLPQAGPVNTPSGSARMLTLASGVITAVAHPEGILEVRMADRDAKNMFSHALSDGLREVFAHAAASDDCKVVLLTGFDNYFSSGGTPETLLAIHQGSAIFTDNLAFQLPLECPVPVIAAMQGHAIGAGWALGMYADFAFFSDESRYFSPYMGYGFTPGAGATLIFPETVGYDLARETLLTAREYSGGALKERGLGHQVLPRDGVLPAAMALARRIAASSRARLVAIKEGRAGPLRAALRETFERELAMHALTFVGRADTLARIEGRLQSVPAAAATPASGQRHDIAALTASLKQMLADELRMEESDIGEDEQFVDLGLDSITGVTWIRRVNEVYGTAIEAIKVYSYPTLAQLAALVQQEAAGPAVALDTAPAAIAGGGQSDIVATLRTLLAHELRMDEGEIGEDEQFVDLGLDSITGVTWIRRVNDLYGTAIEAIKVYSYPTLAQLAAHVAELAVGSGPVADPVKAAEPGAPAATGTHVLASLRPAARARTATPAPAGPVRVAIIGMAGQFAGANNLEQFWSSIAGGVDCITEIAPDRWDIDQYFKEGEVEPGKTYSRWMGALEQYDQFDAAFFNISPREARNMDPQQRLFLQACWHGIEHAGHNPKALGGTRCGVFVGCSAGDYHQLSQREALSGQGFTGAAPSILAARISYFLDLHGPSLSIDTACSSSLVAVAAACDSLATGASDAALAGGVNVMATPAMQVMTSQVGMLSPQGRCYTFDQRANGIATGEGVGVVMLKRLADAELDGDCIYGVIEGWGVNQDGKTNGITAPNAESQTRLQQQVYDRFGIDPAGIGMLEAHGTGTALGDPIEVAGLKAAFAQYTTAKDFCALGSVKSNIGHCLNAAGISGLLKVLLSLQHGQLPPTINFKQLNEHISLRDSPFFISDRLRVWKRAGTRPRMAAINAFGFSGTNAHMVVAEYTDARPAAERPKQLIVPLASRSTGQLLRQAGELHAFIQAAGADGLDLHRLAYTLQVGREPMNERAAFVVTSMVDLERKLAAFVASGGAPGADIFRADVASNRQTMHALGSDGDFQAVVAKWMDAGELARVADLWVKGLALDWKLFNAGAPAPVRMALPLYPFALERFWIDADAVQAAPAAPTVLPAPAFSALSAPVLQTHAPEPMPASDQLQRRLKASLADALFMQASEIDVGKSFTDLGLDSIIGVEWMKEVNKEFGTAVSATRVYDYPNLRELAAFIQTQLQQGQIASAPATATQMPQAPATAAPLQAAAPSLARLQQQLTDSLADALFMQPSEINPDRTFTELGLDSIIGVEWVRTINRQHGASLSATRVYDYPSVRELARFLAGTPIPVAQAAVQLAPVAPVSPIAQAAGPIRFEPKYARQYRELYFYSAQGEGDYEASGEFTVHTTISPDTNVCLEEHVVFGANLLPTDAYIELVCSAFRTWFSCGAVCLKNVVIVSPILGAKGRDTHLQLVFKRSGEELQFMVRSGASRTSDGEHLHMHGAIAPAGVHPGARFAPGFAVEATLVGAQIPTNAGKYYAPLTSLQLGASAALGQIGVARHSFSFCANPFVLYGGLCTAINFAAHVAGQRFGATDDQFLPFRMSQVALAGALDGADYTCYAELRTLERDTVEIYFEIVDAAGRPVVVVDSIGLRRVARSTIERQLAGAPQPAATVRQAGAAEEKVAIIGMSCRLPMSGNADAFWNNLVAGKDCVVEVPQERWGDYAGWYNPDPRHPHTSYSKWAGLLDDIDHFDALFFGIAPAEAELIDPQQRIFLQECWNTIENAGYAPGALSNLACGVYVGCAGGDYARLLADGGQDTAGAAFMGTSNAILAARIAYYLNLKGPALAIDTACSSSLVAVHLACASIRSGENRLALAGGINLLTTPIGHILTSQVGMLSRDGRCATFDALANGIVFSEGCGVLLLKALSDAQRDNDNILGVIEGSGINQDGKTNGITAPSSKAQEQLLRQVYGKFAIDPKRISYVEAHGTATPLGDPIEVNALSAVLGGGAAGSAHCALGSVKSNIGHAGFAAGVAGIVKVLLCLKHRKLVPSIHYSQPNPHIEFGQSPLFVNTEYRDWTCAQPRMAAVSSFGFSGTNAHIVIAEHAMAPQAAMVPVPVPVQVLVPLSAKAPEQLRQKVRDLLGYISGRQQRLDLASLAYTLQVGRDGMDHRTAFIAGSADELAAQLQAWLDGKTRAGNVYSGQASCGDDLLATFAEDPEMLGVIGRWIAGHMLSKVADLWVRGFELDWTLMQQGAKPVRMTLPAYPFAAERCWIAPAGRRSAGTQAFALHPLLHRNTSDLGQQSYTSVFNASEFFLADHQVGGQPVLPAVAYLEMARAALADALPGAVAAQLELQHVAWSQPIAVAAPRSVVIAVFSDSAEQAGFEVYSQDADGAEILHCQGSCAIGTTPAPGRLDLAGLRARMRRGRTEANELYRAFAVLGLEYGPSFRGVVAIERGEGELLAELSLPRCARAGAGAYVLHPGMMDSALQGSITLICELPGGAGGALPFALESLRLIAPCTERMTAWIRQVPGAGAGSASGLFKMDIDLCDQDGAICVQMHGFSSRPADSAGSFDEAHYQSIIAGILSNEISIDEALESGNL